MQFIVFSDIQYHNNTSKSYVLSNGRSSWFEEQLNITHEIFNYAKGNNVNLIIFNGDLFESKSYINVRIYNEVWELYKHYSSEGFQIIFNQGNHDFHSADRDSSFKPFSDIVQVITKPYTYYSHTFHALKFIPYGMVEGNLNKNPDKENNILFTHESIADLKLGPIDYEAKSPLKPHIFSEWDWIFNGHIHKPQNIHNIINIGSVMKQDFGEIDEQKRFIHYNSSWDRPIKSVPILNGFNFFSFNTLTKKLKEKIINNNRDFFRIDIEPSMTLEPIFKKYNVFPNIVKQTERVVRLPETKSKVDEIKEYIKITDTNLDQEKLYKIGLELLEEGASV